MQFAPAIWTALHAGSSQPWDQFAGSLYIPVRSHTGQRIRARPAHSLNPTTLRGSR
jgi:hypothetical protein